MYVKKKFRRMILASIFAGGFIFSPQINNNLNIPVAYAEIKTYTGVGKCVQGDLITIEQAKKYARLRAEINAKDQAGVYLRGYTKMQNFNLTENKIEVITNSIVNFVGETQYKTETTMFDDSPVVRYIATLQANIDTDGINAYINREDKGELQSARKEIIENLYKIENLIERYNRATTQEEKDKIRAELSDADKKVLAGQKLTKGNEFYNKGEYQAAIELYNEALQLNPNYDFAYNNRGNAYRYLKQYDAAISDYNKAIEINPNDEKAYYNRGYVYANLKQYDAAIADYTHAIEINPNDEKAYYNRGWSYYNLKNYDAAISDYNKVIEINPNFPGVYINRGYTYFKMKKYDAAVADYNKAIELDSNNSYGYGNRGIVLAAMKKYSQALEDLNKAVEFGLNDGEVFYYRAKCYKALGEKEKARADFAKAKELGYKG